MYFFNSYLTFGAQTSARSKPNAAEKWYYPSHSYTQYPTPTNIDLPPNPSPSPYRLCSDGDGSVQTDYFHGVFEYLNTMLMEEDDLENKPCMLADSLALQAVEQSLYDVLVDKHHPPSPHQHRPLVLHHYDHHEQNSPQGRYSSTASSYPGPNAFDSSLKYFVEPDHAPELEHRSSLVNSTIQPNLNSIAFTNYLYCVPLNHSPFQILGSSTACQDQGITHFHPSHNNMTYGLGLKEDSLGMLLQEKNGRSCYPNTSTRKRNLYQESRNIELVCRSNKQLASCSKESEQLEMFDKVSLCPRTNPQWQDESEASSSFSEDKTKLQQKKDRRGGRACCEKNTNKKGIVDLKSLLLNCSEAVTNNNISAADKLLRKIRQHSSPYGDSIERLAHYFCNAIDARLAGTGTSIYRAFSSTKISAAQILTSYEAYFKASPFHRKSNIFANKSIKKLAEGRERLHIIDLGILYGFQWPCIIQGFSLCPGGPPKLRITGIDLPQPGFRPAERVEETGRRLAKYCERFNVPFEYNSIAKKWENIQIEDLKIDRDEVLVVNSIYRLRNVPDVTVGENRPRDAVLNLIEKIKPDMFVLGVLNGKYDVPFFQSRFREAISHFSTLFDIFEVTLPHEDRDRFLFEQEVFGRDVINVIACEGSHRVERPETYKKWQARIATTGFRQLPLYQDIVKKVRAKVKLDYHRDFVVDEDNNWMLQCWKGRILYALSLWKPIDD